jgi:hypothetical protein
LTLRIYTFQKKSKRKFIHKFSTTGEKEALEWVQALRNVIYNHDGEALLKRRILFVINPNAGGKSAEHVFKTKYIFIS